MTQKALIIDYKYCTGCHACEVACRNEHGYSLDEWGIEILEKGPEKLHGKWLWDYVPLPSHLCDLCEDRAAQGKDAACVHHCLSKCMEVVELEDAAKRLAELGPKTVCFVPDVYKAAD